MSLGSILYYNALNTILEDNSNLFWDSINKRIGIGTINPADSLHLRKAASLGLILDDSSRGLNSKIWKVGTNGDSFDIQSFSDAYASLASAFKIDRVAGLPTIARFYSGLKLGQIGITAEDGMVRYTGSQFQGYTGGIWRNLDGTNPETASFVNVKNYGAVGDGVTDDTTAIQAAITACPQFGIVLIPPGTYIISSLITILTDNISIIGRGKLKAKADTPFSLMMSASGRTGVWVDGIEFDVNGANRTNNQATTHQAIAFPTSVDCALIRCKIRNSYGYNGTSATAGSASIATRFIAYDNEFIDCGGNETITPSDGLFVRGDGCIISLCRAYRCKDTAFVLEGCNHSIINDCTGIQCTSIAGISNDSNIDCYGNIIDGITGSTLYIGSTGGVITLVTSGTGNLRNTIVSDVNVTVDPAATNLGPLVQARKTSTGRIIELQLNNIGLNSGTTAAKVSQGILISDSDDVVINNPNIFLDTGSGATCIRYDGACVRGTINGGLLRGGDNGISIKNTSAVTVQHVNIQDPGAYGLDVGDTSNVTSILNTIVGAGTSSTVKAAGATLVGPGLFNDWTPVFSSNIGDAATTFNGAITITLARITRIGNEATVTLNWTATLKAVLPDTINLTLPAGYVPQNSNAYSPAIVLNNATYEFGWIKAVTGTNTLAFRRSQLGTWSSAVAVGAFVTYKFEVV